METDALIALFKKVSELDILPAYYPNTSVDSNGNSEPTSDYVKVHVLNIPPTTLSTCSGKSRYEWILQLNIYCREGTGIVKAAQYAQQYKDGIPFNTELTEGSTVLRTQTAGEVIPVINKDDGWVLMPVQFLALTIQ